MTPHYIAQIVEREYNKLDINEMISEFDGIEKYKYGRISDEWQNKRIENQQFLRFIRAYYLLEDCIRLNYHDFVTTELVEKWCGNIIKSRNKMLNDYRAFGWMGNCDFKSWLTEMGHYNRLGRMYRTP